MGEVLREFNGSWHDGVITSMEVDQVPASGSPRAYNTSLESIGPSKAAVGKRKGCSVVDTTPITGSPTILGQYTYRVRSGLTATQYHLLITNTGRLEYLDVTGTKFVVSATAFTSGEYHPSFATMNNLCFVVNGEDAKKLSGSALQAFGLVRPTVGTMAGVGGLAGSLNGSYELSVTFGNSATGHESSLSAPTGVVTVASLRIDLTNIPVSADAQVDRRYVYIRNTATQSNPFRIGTITNNTATTLTVNAVDTSLILEAPDTVENDPPPTDLHYLATHRSRLFASDGERVFFSKIGLPEAFDPEAFEVVNPNDGQKITGLIAVGPLLLIFKSNATYALVGDDPQTWVIDQILPDIGCVSARSLVQVEGAVYWWSEQGPVRWAGGGQALPLADNVMAPDTGPETLNYNQLGLICAAVDFPRQRIMFSVPDVGQTRNTRILPFNYRLQRWESNKWDAIDTASMTVADDGVGQPWVYLGNYAGQVFKWWGATNDGVASGTVIGTFTAVGTTLAVLTALTAAFDITGAGLIERKITLVDALDQLVTEGIRPRIVSNTATALTLADTITGLTAGAVYTYHIGGPDFQFELAWSDFGRPFEKKRMEFVYLLVRQSAARVLVDVRRNYQVLTHTTTGVSSSVWDAGTWDVDVWDGPDQTYNRLRVAKTCTNYSLRLRSPETNRTFTLLRTGARAELLTDKLG